MGISASSSRNPRMRRAGARRRRDDDWREALLAAIGAETGLVDCMYR